MSQLLRQGPAARQLHRLAFPGTINLESLASSPLEELRLRSHNRGWCDSEGNRLVGAPWGVQLAHASTSSDFPVLRTVGFQTVTADAFTFLIKRVPAPGVSSKRLPVAITYVEGTYAAGDVCEQWRAEGVAVEQSSEQVLATAPKASISNILAAHEIGNNSIQNNGQQHDTAVHNHHNRVELNDLSSFIAASTRHKARLIDGSVSGEEIDDAVIVYSVRPTRVEMLVGGPDFATWDRVEWLREEEDGGEHVEAEGSTGTGGRWSAPRRILPY